MTRDEIDKWENFTKDEKGQKMNWDKTSNCYNFTKYKILQNMIFDKTCNLTKDEMRQNK